MIEVRGTSRVGKPDMTPGPDVSWRVCIVVVPGGARVQGWFASPPGHSFHFLLRDQWHVGVARDFIVPDGEPVATFDLRTRETDPPVDWRHFERGAMDTDRLAIGAPDATEQADADDKARFLLPMPCPGDEDASGP